MSCAANNDAVTKSIKYLKKRPFKGAVKMKEMMELKEKKAVRFSISHSGTKDAEKGFYYTSPDFDVGGHQWYLRYYPRGLESGSGDDIALFLHKQQTPDVAIAVLTLTLLDQNSEVVEWEFGMGCFSNKQRSCGCSKFATIEDVERVSAVNDKLRIVCELSVYISAPVIAPPAVPNLVAKLRESEDTKDVTFAVDGETIAAHKLIVATQSPVFKAMLYGPMSEGKSDQIEIPGMKAPVFEAMLHYMYTESLPGNTTVDSQETKDNTNDIDSTVRCLLEAADKYALDGLKLICEGMLCKSITVNTVASTLALAHQRNCKQLKEACLEFLTNPERAHSVMLTAGFVPLIQNFPEVMMDLRAKIDLSKSK